MKKATFLIDMNINGEPTFKKGNTYNVLHETKEDYYIQKPNSNETEAFSWIMDGSVFNITGEDKNTPTYWE